MKRLFAALAMLNVLAVWYWWEERRARKRVEAELRDKWERLYRGAVR